MKQGKKKATLPSSFAQAYPNHTFAVISPEMMWDVIR
jgi:hypothetical protein